MGKSTKKSASKVVAPAAAPTKPLKKGKREADNLIEKQINVKKLKKDENNEAIKKKKAEAKVKKAVDSSSSEGSSTSEEEEKVPKSKVAAVKKGLAAAAKNEKSTSDSEEETSSDEATVEKKPVTVNKNGPLKKKEESSDESDSDDESSSDEDVPAAKKAPAAASKNGSAAVSKKGEQSSEDSESDDEDDSTEESSDEEAQKKKLKVQPTLVSKKASNSDDSSEEEDESSEDEEEDSETPKKKDTDVDMVDAEPTQRGDSISDKKTPKTPATPKIQTSEGSKTLFVGNLPFSVEKDDVVNFFKDAGEVVDVRFAVNQDGSIKGFGHVEFATAGEAKQALELNGQQLMGRDLRLDLARERGEYTPQSGQERNSFQKGERVQGQTIFVRGFDRNDEESQIRSTLEEHFGSCGEISRVSIPKDQEGGFKGIAYVDFKDKDSFKKALELDQSELGGSVLTVEEAKPRDGRDSFGGGRGGRNSGRFSGGGRSGGRDSGGRFGGRRGGARGAGGGRFGSGGRGRGNNKPSFSSFGAGKKTKFDD